MKTAIIASLLVFLVLVAPAEESYMEAMVRKVMKVNGWVTDEMSFHELNRESPTILIRRNGRLVGYYTEESVWKKTKAKPVDLSDVTAIVFGQLFSGMPDEFRIEESSEIAVWVAAYIEHTESLERFAMFIPTSENAGFERRRDKIQFGGAYGDTYGLRFYAGERKVLELPGHLELESLITPGGTRNEVLHELTRAKLAELSAQASQVKQSDVEQNGADRSATAPELKSEGKEKPKPESDGRPQ
jgi:hypothetical protein